MQGICILSFFTEVKKCSKLEDYLDFDILKKNKKLLTKFCCGDHKLFIRSGSWQKIERNERWCRFCNSHALEDEWHVMHTFECSTFHSKREALVQKISVLNPTVFSTPLDRPQILSLIFQDVQLALELSKMLKQIFDMLEC